MVTVLNSTGTGILYSTFLGGTYFEWVAAMERGNDNSVFVAGVTLSTDFPITPGAFDQSMGVVRDAFISKLGITIASVQESSVIEKLKIYPNPCEDFLNIKSVTELVGSELEIYDIFGKIILTGIIQSEESKIDISQLSPATYYLKLKNEPYVEKIIKIK
jgi:hypothetical protein